MQSIVLLLWLALCAEQDVRERQIANTLTLGAAGLALVWLFATGHTWIGAQPADAALALALVMLLTLPGYILGRLGAGDVKLLGALALATDQWYLLGTFIGASIAATLTLQFNLFMELPFRFRFPTTVFTSMVCMALVVAVAGSALPAYKLLRKSISTVLRRQ